MGPDTTGKLSIQRSFLGNRRSMAALAGTERAFQTTTVELDSRYMGHGSRGVGQMTNKYLPAPSVLCCWSAARCDSRQERWSEGGAVGESQGRTADSVVTSSRQSDRRPKGNPSRPFSCNLRATPWGEERQRQSDRGVGERARSERTKWESDTLCSRRPMIVATRKNTVGV